MTTNIKDYIKNICESFSFDDIDNSEDKNSEYFSANNEYSEENIKLAIIELFQKCNSKLSPNDIFVCDYSHRSGKLVVGAVEKYKTSNTGDIVSLYVDNHTVQLLRDFITEFNIDLICWKTVFVEFDETFPLDLFKYTGYPFIEFKTYCGNSFSNTAKLIVKNSDKGFFKMLNNTVRINGKLYNIRKTYNIHGDLNNAHPLLCDVIGIPENEIMNESFEFDSFSQEDADESEEFFLADTDKSNQEILKELFDKFVPKNIYGTDFTIEHFRIENTPQGKAVLYDDEIELPLFGDFINLNTQQKCDEFIEFCLEYGIRKIEGAILVEVAVGNQKKIHVDLSKILDSVSEVSIFLDEYIGNYVAEEAVPEITVPNDCVVQFMGGATDATCNCNDEILESLDYILKDYFYMGYPDMCEEAEADPINDYEEFFEMYCPKIKFAAPTQKMNESIEFDEGNADSQEEFYTASTDYDLDKIANEFFEVSKNLNSFPKNKNICGITAVDNENGITITSINPKKPAVVVLNPGLHGKFSLKESENKVKEWKNLCNFCKLNNINGFDGTLIVRDYVDSLPIFADNDWNPFTRELKTLIFTKSAMCSNDMVTNSIVRLADVIDKIIPSKIESIDYADQSYCSIEDFKERIQELPKLYESFDFRDEINNLPENDVEEQFYDADVTSFESDRIAHEFANMWKSVLIANIKDGASPSAARNYLNNRDFIEAKPYGDGYEIILKNVNTPYDSSGFMINMYTRENWNRFASLITLHNIIKLDPRIVVYPNFSMTDKHTVKDYDVLHGEVRIPDCLDEFTLRLSAPENRDVDCEVTNIPISIEYTVVSSAAQRHPATYEFAPNHFRRYNLEFRKHSTLSESFDFDEMQTNDTLDDYFNADTDDAYYIKKCFDAFKSNLDMHYFDSEEAFSRRFEVKEDNIYNGFYLGAKDGKDLSMLIDAKNAERWHNLLNTYRISTLYVNLDIYEPSFDFSKTYVEYVKAISVFVDDSSNFTFTLPKHFDKLVCVCMSRGKTKEYAYTNVDDANKGMKLLGYGYRFRTVGSLLNESFEFDDSEDSKEYFYAQTEFDKAQVLQEFKKFAYYNDHLCDYDKNILDEYQCENCNDGFRLIFVNDNPYGTVAICTVKDLIEFNELCDNYKIVEFDSCIVKHVFEPFTPTLRYVRKIILDIDDFAVDSSKNMIIPDECGIKIEFNTCSKSYYDIYDVRKKLGKMKKDKRTINLANNIKTYSEYAQLKETRVSESFEFDSIQNDEEDSNEEFYTAELEEISELDLHDAQIAMQQYVATYFCGEDRSQINDFKASVDKEHHGIKISFVNSTVNKSLCMIYIDSYRDLKWFNQICDNFKITSVDCAIRKTVFEPITTNVKYVGIMVLSEDDFVECPFKEPYDVILMPDNVGEYEMHWYDGMDEYNTIEDLRADATNMASDEETAYKVEKRLMTLSEFDSNDFKGVNESFNFDDNGIDSSEEFYTAETTIDPEEEIYQFLVKNNILHSYVKTNTTNAKDFFKYTPCGKITYLTCTETRSLTKLLFYDNVLLKEFCEICASHQINSLKNINLCISFGESSFDIRLDKYFNYIDTVTFHITSDMAENVDNSGIYLPRSFEDLCIVNLFDEPYDFCIDEYDDYTECYKHFIRTIDAQWMEYGEYPIDEIIVYMGVDGKGDFIMNESFKFSDIEGNADNEEEFYTSDSYEESPEDVFANFILTNKLISNDNAYVRRSNGDFKQACIKLKDDLHISEPSWNKTGKTILFHAYNLVFEDNTTLENFCKLCEYYNITALDLTIELDVSVSAFNIDLDEYFDFIEKIGPRFVGVDSYLDYTDDMFENIKNSKIFLPANFDILLLINGRVASKQNYDGDTNYAYAAFLTYSKGIIKNSFLSNKDEFEMSNHVVYKQYKNPFLKESFKFNDDSEEAFFTSDNPLYTEEFYTADCSADAEACLKDWKKFLDGVCERAEADVNAEAEGLQNTVKMFYADEYKVSFDEYNRGYFKKKPVNGLRELEFTILTQKTADEFCAFIERWNIVDISGFQLTINMNHPYNYNSTIKDQHRENPLLVKKMKCPKCLETAEINVKVIFNLYTPTELYLPRKAFMLNKCCQVEDLSDKWPYQISVTKVFIYPSN